jgi:AcrR family transcriptional regulator
MSDTAPDSPVRAVQERSRDTRQRILEAAQRALVEDGYSGATTLRIQELAGVTRGRLLHHYPSRDDLLVAAVAHLTEARMAGLADDVTWSAEPRERIRQIVDRMWETFSQPYFWASTELWLAARANPRLRDALQPHERRLSTFIVGKLGSFFGPELTAHPNYVAVRDLLVTSMRGAALTYAVRPRDPLTEHHLEQWTSIAAQLLIEP